jgi:hypothetical protein
MDLAEGFRHHGDCWIVKLMAANLHQKPLLCVEAFGDRARSLGIVGRILVEGETLVSYGAPMPEQRQIVKRSDIPSGVGDTFSRERVREQLP